MIVVSGRNREQERFIVIGLSDDNIDRLKAGQPIRLTHVKDRLPPGLEILLLHGRTDEQAHGMLSEYVNLPPFPEKGR